MWKYLFVLLVWFPALAWAAPAIEFQSEKHDFGSVIQGAQLEYQFEFSNRGTDELIIDSVNTS
jgi:uncharacterized protein DUF1573